jgi:GTPase SAR1 family protein
LSRIEKLCEASIVVLVSEQIDRKKEADLIEDIKAQFKERLRESLRQGTITREQLDAAKAEVAALSKQTADLMRSDVYALTGLYEAIHEHAKRIVRELDELVAQITAKRTDLDEDKRLFAGLEKVLVSLVTDYRLKLQSVEIRKETEHDAILFENRKEVLDHLFDLLQN